MLILLCNAMSRWQDLERTKSYRNRFWLVDKCLRECRRSNFHRKTDGLRWTLPLPKAIRLDRHFDHQQFSLDPVNYFLFRNFSLILKMSTWNPFLAPQLASNETSLLIAGSVVVMTKGRLVVVCGGNPNVGGGRVAHVVLRVVVLVGLVVVSGWIPNNDGGWVAAVWSGGCVGIGGGHCPKLWMFVTIGASILFCSSIGGEALMGFVQQTPWASLPLLA